MVPCRAQVNNGSLTIVHVLTSLHVGGGERVALILARRQVELGHRVVLVSLESEPGGPLGRSFEAVGAELALVEKAARGTDLGLWPRLFRRLRAERADVVHTHNAMPQIYAAPAGRAAGARVIHTEHGRHQSSERQLKLRRLTARAAHRFIAVSEATCAHVRSIRLADEVQLGVVLNGTDVRRFHRDEQRRAAVRADWGVPDDGLVVGTVGRMAEVKNQGLLVRALAPRLGPRCRLVIAGDGDDRPKTEALVGELGVADYVHLLGTISDVPGAMSGFDLFALSSHSEGLPMVLAEAMSASLPVVATAVGGVPKVVREGETGRLTPPSDEEALRAALTELLDHPEQRCAFGTRARAIADAEYSSARMATEYLELYRGGAEPAR
jgi:glycosyltransferase involved in cell wall biosynthesis